LKNKRKRRRGQSLGCVFVVVEIENRKPEAKQKQVLKKIKKKSDCNINGCYD
jgi:hypothetical protein